MAITQTPPVKKGCKSCGSTYSDWWQNETTKTWWFKDKDTKETYNGKPGAPGITPRIGVNGNWWLGNTDTGVPASGTVEIPSPESATDLFD